MFSGFKKIAVGAVVALIAAGSVALAATANAESTAPHPQSLDHNGQVIRLCAPHSGTALVSGENQNGTYLKDVEFQAGPHCPVTKKGETKYFWRTTEVYGPPTIKWYVPQIDPQWRNSTCKVPTNQPGKQDFDCHYPR